MKQLLLVIALAFLTACVTTKTASNVNSKVNYKLQAGMHHGGIVENTDMDVNPDLEPDAFSGATKVGISIGAHTEIKVRNNLIESGLDVLTSKHEFTYNDNVNNYIGKREIRATQFRIPISYNFTLLDSDTRTSWLQLKLGLSAGYTVFNINSKKGSLPTYTTDPWSVGPFFGLEVLPLTLANGSSIGMHLEMHRSGQQAYKDFYNIGDMPGLSYFKLGISWRLSN